MWERKTKQEKSRASCSEGYVFSSVHDAGVIGGRQV